jgi:hypothetical protein
MMTRLKSEPLLRTALVTLLFFVLLRVGGAQTHVGVLSGTLAAGKTGLFFGLLYALSWLSVVIVVPVLMLAGLGSLALEKGRPR